MDDNLLLLIPEGTMHASKVPADLIFDRLDAGKEVHPINIDDWRRVTKIHMPSGREFDVDFNQHLQVALRVGRAHPLGLMVEVRDTFLLSTRADEDAHLALLDESGLPAEEREVFAASTRERSNEHDRELRELMAREPDRTLIEHWLDLGGAMPS